MRASRLILKSVITDLSDLFGPQAVMGKPYNVYNEQDMRAVTVPVFPFVYLFDYGVVFQKEQLPLIVVHPSTSLITMEMGNVGFDVQLGLHLFGRDRAQRYDLSSAIMESVSSFNIRDASGDIVHVAELQGNPETGRIWAEEYNTVGRDIAIEASLANWVTLVTTFQASFSEL